MVTSSAEESFNTLTSCSTLLAAFLVPILQIWNELLCSISETTNATQNVAIRWPLSQSNMKMSFSSIENHRCAYMFDDLHSARGVRVHQQSKSKVCCLRGDENAPTPCWAKIGFTPPILPAQHDRIHGVAQTQKQSGSYVFSRAYKTVTASYHAHTRLSQNWCICWYRRGLCQAIRGQW